MLGGLTGKGREEVIRQTNGPMTARINAANPQNASHENGE
jgi:hypothetical protein